MNELISIIIQWRDFTSHISVQLVWDFKSYHIEQWKRIRTIDGRGKNVNTNDHARSTSVKMQVYKILYLVSQL